jgi:hypothetical protein
MAGVPGMDENAPGTKVDVGPGKSNVRVPNKYGDKDKTDLHYDVKSGENKIDIEMTK